MTLPRSPRSVLLAFLESEAAGGIVLIIAAALAMLMANGPFAAAYHEVFHHKLPGPVVPHLGPWTVHLIINDGLMAIFFLFVGLEIKRELVDGRLASARQRVLPVVAAALGMVIPAIVYLAVTAGNPGLRLGWAIPAATDIAFAMGVLALLGKRVPTSLKLFLVTVAIVDDMGAIAIIALAYSHGLDLTALLAAAGVLVLMIGANRAGVRRLDVYLLGFGALWLAILLSGVHATVAGVLAAFTIPVIATPGTPDADESPLHRLEHALDAPVAFLIVPLFGLANAGVDLSGIALPQLLAPLPLGIALGLVIGKQLGILSGLGIARALGAPLPAGATWRQLHGIAVLCGVGFTMSLFIGGLAFRDPALVEEAKLGTLAGSVISALLGLLLLRIAPLHPRHAEIETALADAIERDGDGNTD